LVFALDIKEVGDPVEDVGHVAVVDRHDFSPDSWSILLYSRRLPSVKLPANSHDWKKL
jgi:hypothetical protein